MKKPTTKVGGRKAIGNSATVARSGKAVVRRPPQSGKGVPRTFDERTAIRQIDLIAGALQLSKQEIGRMFGDVSRQAVDHWLQSGVPIERAADIDRVAEVIRELARRFKPQRLPQIARRPMPILDGRSILEVLSMQGAAPMHEFFRRWDSYVPDVAPIREADFAK